MRTRTVPLDALSTITIATLLQRQANGDLQDIALSLGVSRKRCKWDQIAELLTNEDARFRERFEFEITLVPKAGVNFNQLVLDL